MNKIGNLKEFLEEVPGSILINPDVEPYASAEAYEKNLRDKERARALKLRAEQFRSNGFR